MIDPLLLLFLVTFTNYLLRKIDLFFFIINIKILVYNGTYLKF